jgi:ubiquinone/menaquinone biosynthesis C-methylase UbiE
MTTSPGTALHAPDFAAIKQRQRAMWASGNYALIGTTLQTVGDQLAKALEVHPGSKVLDVAAGNGNAGLALARLWCDVTSTDFVPSLLDAGRARAEAEGLTLQWAQADAEHLPFEDASFDALTFTYLLRYVDDPAATMRELARVVRPGGRIAMLDFFVPAGVARPAWELYVRIGLPVLGRAISPGWG